jgi:hypothetical protein
MDIMREIASSGQFEPDRSKSAASDQSANVIHGAQ